MQREKGGRERGREGERERGREGEREREREREREGSEWGGGQEDETIKRNYLLNCGQISLKVEFHKLLSKSSVGNKIDSCTDDLVTDSSTWIERKEQQW